MPHHVPKTRNAHLNPITFDNGRAVQGFFKQGEEYFGWEIGPPDSKASDGTRSMMAPASHWHLRQSESFHVKSGAGIWYVGNRAVHLKKGDDITIPPCTRHRFENEPGSTEPLEILYRYDPEHYTSQERFFRNFLTYLEDCRQHNVPPSVYQLQVFLAANWGPSEFVKTPDWMGEWFRCAVNSVHMLGQAAVGYLFLGYRVSYKEYYDPEGVGRNVVYPVPAEKSLKEA